MSEIDQACYRIAQMAKSAAPDNEDTQISPDPMLKVATFC